MEWGQGTAAGQTRRPPLYTPGSELARRGRLAEMPGCWLEVRCGPCGSATLIPVKLLAGQHGGHVPIGAILPRLACRRCRTPPLAAWLNETHNRAHTHGAPPGWSVQLIGLPEEGA